MYVSVHVEADDILSELSDDQLIEELKRRRKTPADEQSISTKDLALRVYDHFRGKDAPGPVRELVWEVVGKIL